MEVLNFKYYHQMLPLDVGFEGITVRLLDILIIDGKNLSSFFIKKNTEIVCNDKEAYFTLDISGKIILFIMKDERPEGGIFTALRLWTEPKERRYRKQIGKKIIVTVR